MSIVKDKTKIVGIPNVFDSSDISIHDQYESLIKNKKREWFSEHAYMCLPIVIGNQYGYVVKALYDFDVVWNGGNNVSDLHIMFKDGIQSGHKGQWVTSNFGLGIITIQNNFNLRTTDSINLMTINPPNYFIDGIHHMTGVVECDNLRRDFTFNLKVTRPNYLIQIKKNDWIGCFIPVPRYFVDSFELVDAKDVLTEEEIKIEIQAAADAGKERETVDKKKRHGAGRRYLKGEDVYGNKFPDHQRRLK